MDLGRQPHHSYRDKVLNIDGQSMQAKERGSCAIEAAWKDYLDSLNGFYTGSDEGRQSDSSRVEGGRRSNLCPKLHVTREEYEAWCAPWRKSLIIKLLGISMSIYKLRPKLQSMWKTVKPFKLLDLENDYFIASFETNEDLEYVLMDGPWMVADHYVMVQRWQPNFDPWAADNQRRIAAWVRIRAIPVEFYNYESLWRLGGLIGRTLKVDLVTSLSSRGRFARVCVELDLHLQLLPRLEIFGRTFFLEYEGLHLVCFDCGMFGHRKEECLLWSKEKRDRDRVTESARTGGNTTKEAGSSEGNSVSGSATDSGEGNRASSSATDSGVREESGKRTHDAEGVGKSTSPMKNSSLEKDLFGPRMLVRRSLQRRGGIAGDLGYRSSFSAGNKKVKESRDSVLMEDKAGDENRGDLVGRNELPVREKASMHVEDKAGRRNVQESVKIISGLGPRHGKKEGRRNLKWVKVDGKNKHGRSSSGSQLKREPFKILQRANSQVRLLHDNMTFTIQNPFTVLDVDSETKKDKGEEVVEHLFLQKEQRKETTIQFGDSQLGMEEDTHVNLELDGMTQNGIRGPEAPKFSNNSQ